MPVEKIAFSCCDEPHLRLALERSGRSLVIVCGIEAHVCVLQTTIDLLELGYHPVVVADCIASRFPEDKAVALDRMRTEGVLITSCESILFELAREINRGAEGGMHIAEAQNMLLKLAGVLGLTLKEETQSTPDAEAFVSLLASIRDDLRQNRQWQLADRIRKGLADLGVTLEDTPEGTRWKYRT